MFGALAIVGFVFFLTSFIQASESDCGMPLGAHCQAQLILELLKENRDSYLLASVLSLVSSAIQLFSKKLVSNDK